MTELILPSQTLKDVPEAIATAVAIEVKDLQTRLDAEKEKVKTLESYRRDSNDLNTQIRNLETENHSLKKEKEDLQARNDALEAKKDDRTDEDINKIVNERVRQRMDVLELAKAHLDSVDDTLSNLKLKQQIVIENGISKERADAYTEDQLDVAIDTFTVTKKDKQRKDKFENQKRAFDKPVSSQATDRFDAEQKELDKIRTDSITLVENAWMSNGGDS